MRDDIDLKSFINAEELKVALNSSAEKSSLGMTMKVQKPLTIPAKRNMFVGSL